MHLRFRHLQEIINLWAAIGVSLYIVEKVDELSVSQTLRLDLFHVKIHSFQQWSVGGDP